MRGARAKFKEHARLWSVGSSLKRKAWGIAPVVGAHGIAPLLALVACQRPPSSEGSSERRATAPTVEMRAEATTPATPKSGPSRADAGVVATGDSRRSQSVVSVRFCAVANCGVNHRQTPPGVGVGHRLPQLEKCA